MKIAKGAFLFILIALYIILGIVTHFFITFIHPRSRYKLISAMTNILCKCIIKVAGVKLLITGETSCLKEKGNLIISNHLGYLDGIILSSLFPLIFVTKLQVKTWPVIGWMSRVGGTVFLDRSRKLKSAKSIEEIGNYLKNGLNVLFFPEGTSTDGSRMLPFNVAYFQAPLDAKTPVIAITIQYTRLNSEPVSLANRDFIFWYGQVDFFRHLSNLLGARNIEAKIIIHPKIESKAYLNHPDPRKELSEYCRQVISKDFSFLKQD